jgi:hypothetical protein
MSIILKSKEYETQEWKIDLELHKGLNNLENSLKVTTQNLIADLRALTKNRSVTTDPPVGDDDDLISSEALEEFIEEVYTPAIEAIETSIRDILNKITFIQDNMNRVTSVNGQIGDVIITKETLGIEGASSGNFLTLDTLSDMKDNRNLKIGNVILVAETESFYTIDNIGEIELKNGLKATKNTNNYVTEDEITELITEIKGDINESE